MAHQGTPQEVTFEFLDAFADAWNRHDVDAIMSAMTDDCIFEASSGLSIKGTIYDGQRQVRKGVEAKTAKRLLEPIAKLSAGVCGLPAAAHTYRFFRGGRVEEDP